jgi:nitrate reductase gamma subunit
MSALYYLTYLAIPLFAVVVLIKVFRISSMPVHLRWEVYPVPHEGFKKAKYGGSYFEEPNWWTKPRPYSLLSEMSVMIPEILFLRGVWEANRSLWFWSWAFHFGLYLAIGAAGLIAVSSFAGPESGWGATLASISGVLAIITYVLGSIGCLGMLAMRLFSPKLRPYTAWSSIFNLVFILGIFLTGLCGYSMLGQAGWIAELQGFVAGLFGPASAATQSAAVTRHVGIILAFMVYMPFTHMSHFVLKWFTYHEIRWNDTPNVKGSKLEKQIIECLSYRPTWAAKHWRTDGKKTWVDIATEEVFKDEK